MRNRMQTRNRHLNSRRLAVPNAGTPRERFRRLATFFIFFLALAVLGVQASAHDMKGDGVRLRAGTLSGGGSAALDPAGSLGPTGTTVGEWGPLGVSEGANIRLIGGFWPAVHFVPEPAPSVLGISAVATLYALRRVRRNRS